MTTKALNVLVVEDSPADAKLIDLHLTKSSTSYKMTFKEMLFEGIREANDHKFDVVLLDMSLPDSRGFKTLDTFVKNVPRLPIIVLTSLNNEVVGIQTIRAGAQDFLVKGQFDYKLLGRSIRYAIQRFDANRRIENQITHLEKTKKKYADIQRIAGLGYWEIDIVTNEMIWSNEVYTLLGFSPGSIQPSVRSYLDYVYPDDVSNVEKSLDKTMREGSPLTMEHRIVVSGHTLKWLSLSLRIVSDPMTSKTFLIGVVQEITNRKLIEKLLQERAFNKESNRSKQQALGEFGFHIRTPMTSISNLLYLMDQSNNRKQNDLLNGLRTSFQELNLMIINLLNFSIISEDNLSLKIEEFHLDELIQSVIKLGSLKAAVKENSLKFSKEADVPEYITADASKINQILYNIIDFAILNADGKGQIRAKLKSIPRGSDKHQFSLSVQMPAQIYSQLEMNELANFEDLSDASFEDLQRPIQLAIAKKLTQCIGGKMTIVESGSKCDVEIEFVAKVKSIQESYIIETPFIPLNILLVEDHFLNQIATKKLLTNWSEHVNVDIAENGLVAVDKFSAHQYDIILMDLQMPVMDGYEATIKIREKSEVPILGLSASSSKEEEKKCLKNGMNAYIAKPFKPDELFQKIMELIPSQYNKLTG